MVAKVEDALRCLAKYHGMASILIPCAKWEMALAPSNKYSAFLFFKSIQYVSSCKITPCFTMLKENRQITYGEALSKLMRYCSYQERSEREVVTKAKDLGLQPMDLPRLIEELQKENFIDESRFAEAYVRGKVRIKKWGVLKIKEGLSQKGVDRSVITAALKTIDQELYLKNLEELVHKRGYSKEATASERSKVYRYLLSKGYESNVVLLVLS